MATHPSGAVVAVFGTQLPISGACCEHNCFCASILTVDTLVRFKTTTVEKSKRNTGIQFLLLSLTRRATFFPQNQISTSQFKVLFG